MNQTATAPDSHTSSSPGFIPRLCSIQSLLAVILCVQVLAFVISLIRTDTGLIDWQVLGFTSLLLHSIGLISAAALCLIRALVHQKSITTQATAALVTLIVVSGGATALSLVMIGKTVDESIGIIVRNALVAALLGGLFLRYAYLDYLAKQREKAELHARIEALQSRIRPHFLFNSMNTIASLIATRPETAEEAVLDLSELFRATLNTQTSYVSIGEELHLCKKYLNIEGLRLGNRLQLEWQVNDEVLGYQIPPLTLQPLVENAIYHGIQPLKQGGTIRFEGYLQKDSIYLLVSNPVGEEQVNKHGNRIALRNIADRLAALYANQAVLKTSQLENVFTTTLRLPAKPSRGSL